MLSHLAAKQLVDSRPAVLSAPDPVRLSLLTRVLSMVETQYGAGWRGAGVGSHNWGAITGTYQGAYFQHRDSRPVKTADGRVIQKPYVAKFRKYPTDGEGANDMAALLQRSYSRAVQAVPDWGLVARYLYGYYLGTKPKEGAIADETLALTKRAAEVVAGTGEALPDPTRPPAEPPGDLLYSQWQAWGGGLLPVVRYGSRGAEVAVLQTLVGGLKVDGNFGPKTLDAIRRVQRAARTPPDGIVGPLTWTAIIQRAQ